MTVTKPSGNVNRLINEALLYMNFKPETIVSLADWAQKNTRHSILGYLRSKVDRHNQVIR